MSDKKTLFLSFILVSAFSVAASALGSAPVPSFNLESASRDTIAASIGDQRVPAPLAAALSGEKGVQPVIVTVPGLKFGEIGFGHFELRGLLKLIATFLPHKKIDEADLVNAFFSVSRNYFFLEDGEDLPRETVRLPDNYLEARLAELPEFAQSGATVIPFQWSRDPGDSDRYVAEFEQRLYSIWLENKDNGRPIYILAHSWGTMLMHTALHRLSRSHPEVRIARFISTGSPLVPGNPVTQAFVSLEIKKEHLEKAVTKPANVGVWRNIWAMRDPYSNAIPAADQNEQVDAVVEYVEPTLINFILHNKPLKKAARADLWRIRNIKDWHSVYIYDFKTTLETLKKDISVTVFRPVVAPQVLDCAPRQPAQ